MTKTELQTIILKVQSECSLEEPTKITYYWNEDGKIVFKFFFDSLYIPKNLRIEDEDGDKIQNMFSVQNVYEFKDDFKIIDFDTDEGFVKVLPKDQNFKIVNSYKDLNDDSVEESVLRLAGKKLNEKVARANKMILQEDEDELDQLLASQEDADTREIEEDPEEEAEEEKISGGTDIYFIPISNCMPREPLVTALKAIKKCDEWGKSENTKKVFISYYWGKDLGFAKQNFGYMKQQMTYLPVKLASYAKGSIEGTFTKKAESLYATFDKKKSRILYDPKLSNKDEELSKSGIKNVVEVSFPEEVVKVIQESNAKIEELEKGPAKKIYEKFVEYVKAGKDAGVSDWNEYWEETIPGWKEAKEETEKIQNSGDEAVAGQDAALGFVCCCYAMSQSLLDDDKPAVESDKKSTESALKNSSSITDSGFEKELRKAADQIAAQTTNAEGSTAKATEGDSGFGQTKSGVGGGAGTEFKDKTPEHGKDGDKGKSEPENKKPQKAAFLPNTIKIFCLTKGVKADFDKIAETFKVGK